MIARGVGATRSRCEPRGQDKVSRWSARRRGRPLGAPRRHLPVNEWPPHLRCIIIAAFSLLIIIAAWFCCMLMSSPRYLAHVLARRMIGALRRTILRPVRFIFERVLALPLAIKAEFGYELAHRLAMSWGVLFCVFFFHSRVGPAYQWLFLLDGPCFPRRALLLLHRRSLLTSGSSSWTSC